MFNIRRWVQSRCNFARLLNSISSASETIVVILDGRNDGCYLMKEETKMKIYLKLDERMI